MDRKKRLGLPSPVTLRMSCGAELVWPGGHVLSTKDPNSVMNPLSMIVRAALAASLTVASLAAQGSVPQFPAGQPALAAIRPTLSNTVPAAIVQVAGNPALVVESVVMTPIVPAGQPMFTLIGTPTAAPIAIGGPPLFAGYGLPGFLAMDTILAVSPGVTGTFGSPPMTLPIPPGLGPIGVALTAQIAAFTPGGIGLTGAVGIDI